MIGDSVCVSSLVGAGFALIVMVISMIVKIVIEDRAK